jgi:transglutaminase-like putative cysteine protease
MLGLLRYNGIPCRYVSGYLHQGQDCVGSAQMHAWIEAYIPNAGWVGFDPTYNRVVDEHYIKVADGLDYEDCRPLKEFLHTNSLNRTRSALKVIDQQQ